MSIQRKLVLLVLGAILPLVALITLASFTRIESVRETVLQSVHQDALAGSLAVDNALGDTAHLLETLAFTSELRRKDQPSSSQLLGHVLSLYPYIENLFVADLNGEVWASGLPDANGPPPGVADRPWFKEASLEGRLALSEFQFSRRTGQPVVVLATPLAHGNGKPSGVVAAAFSLQRLPELLKQPEFPEDALAMLLDASWRVLATTAESGSELGRPLQPGSLLAQLEHGPGTSMFARDSERQYLSVSRTQRAPWVVAVTVPAAVVEGPVRQEQLRSLLGVLATLGIAVLAAMVMSRRITRPIRALVRSAAAIEQGRFEERVQVSTRDETAELAAAFNRMGAEVETQRAQLKQSNRLLAELLRSTSELTSVLHHQTLLDKIMEEAKRLLGAHEITLWLRESDPDQLRLVACSETKHDSQPEQRMLRPGASLGWSIVASGQAYQSEDIQMDQRWANKVYVREAGLHGYLGIPLMFYGQSID